MKSYIGPVLKSFIEDEVLEVTIEPVKDNPMDSRNIAPPGIDSNPIAEDQGVAITLDESDGKTAFIGVIPDPLVEPGEIKIFSRNSSGVIQAEVYCKKDKFIRLKNTETGMKTLITSLITEVKAIITAGSPTTQTVSAASQSKLDLVQVEFDKLFTDA